MKRRPWRTWLTAYTFLIPSLLVLGAFTFYPVVEAARLSLWRWRILRGDPVFIGLANYETLFSSADFWQAVGNTIVFAVGSIPTSMILALFLALLLNRPLRGLAFYRTAYFLPTITSLVAVSVVWMWIYHPDVGLMNQLIGLVGLPPARWLNEPRTAMLSLIILGVWRGLGYNVIIYLGGLQSIPVHLYEAAKIDGANRWQLLRYITWPLLTPTSFFILIIAVINSFQSFTQVHVMTQGGPIGSTTVIVYYLFQQAFQQFNMGYGSAIAMVLFVVILVLTILQFGFLGKRVHYQ